MRRVLIYDRFDAQVCELSENDVFELTRHEVVNGAHELTITTTQVLEKGYRVLMEDDRGYWHEWCVSGIDEQHANGSRPYGSYYCVWSLQPDLMGTRVSAMPGVQTPVTAAQALDAVLSGTSRWTRGTITNTNTGGASMYDTDGWSAMSTLVANWGGEVDTTIGVSALSGVVSRQVDLYAQQGESTAKRRFDFGADLVSIRRTIADDPLYCRITPRGKGEATEGGGYGRKITIESVNDGKDYLVNDAMVDLAKLPDGNGGWEYPTLEVENSECETPSELLAWAQSVLDSYTNPKITYEVNVVQAAKEGIDLQGVSLGDAVQVVDGKFNDLRLTGRVMEMTTDELAHTTTQLTIGNVGEGISERFSDLYSGIKTAEQSVTQLAQSLSTADYIDSLLDRINAEINATGGYAYIVPGNGILTFDVAVADPLNPVEASRVVEIKGGTIRIANSKTAQGQWEWKTVFTSGHVAAELVTAAQLTTGYIGNSSGTYWDLDNNLLHLPATTIVDDVPISEYVNVDVPNVNLVRNGDFATGGISYWSKASSATATVGSDSTFQSYLELVQSSGGSYYGIYTNATTSFTHEPYKTYSLSFYAKSDADRKLSVRVGTSSAAVNVYLNAVDIGTEWQRYEATITPELAGALRFNINAAGTLYLTNVMLVEGNRPLDFMQDPRDLYGTQVSAATSASMIRAYGAGVLVCRQGNTVGALVNANGSFDVVKVTWSGTTPTASTVYATYGTSCVVGDTSKAHIEVSQDYGLGVYGANPSNTGQIIEIGRVGYESATKPYFTFGTRASGSTKGTSSVALGWNTTASGNYSFTQGNGTKATAAYSAAFGTGTTASGSASVAFGYNSTAGSDQTIAMGNGTKTNAQNSFAGGLGSIAGGRNSLAFGDHAQTGNYYETALGKYNVVSSGSYTNVLVVGNGTSSARKNILTLDNAGHLTIASTLTQNSDRRLKQHVAYLGDDANVIINRLKPAVFIKDGGRHYGFYAQDVQRADIWDTKTVEAQHTDESLDFDPLTLDYTALIAPLTAYVQNLEKRVAELERRLNDAE